MKSKNLRRKKTNKVRHYNKSRKRTYRRNKTNRRTNRTKRRTNRKKRRINRKKGGSAGGGQPVACRLRWKPLQLLMWRRHLWNLALSRLKNSMNPRLLPQPPWSRPRAR